MEISVLIVSFLILLAIGVPIAWSIGISGMLTLLVSVPAIPTFTTVVERMATGLDSFSLLAIPLFILAGQLMNQGGIARRLIDFAKALVGSLPGGLAHVNIVAAMLFGAISGSAVAAASAIGGFMGQAMTQEGYDKDFAAAVNITSSTTGLVIPPSNVLIVYSLASGGVSVAALFLAGYLPGLLTGVALMIVTYFLARKNHYPTGNRVALLVLARQFLKALPSLLLLVVVIGGIVAGIFTATEASAIAVAYCLILVKIYGEVRLRDLSGIFLASASTSGLVLLLVAASMSMSWVLAYEHIPQDIASILVSISDNKFVVLMIINLILLGVGIFMDITPAVLIFTPIFLPVVTNLGINPVHFGIIMVLNLCIGICTPPVGSVLFVGVGVAKTSIRKVIKPLLPLFIAMLLALLLVTMVPAISLWLPGIFGF